MATLTAARPRRRSQVIIKRLILTLVTVALIGYMVISAVIANVLTVPKRREVTQVNGQWQFKSNPQKELGLPFEEVSYTARGERVQIGGWFVPGQPDAPAIMIVHGKDGCRICFFQGGSWAFLKAMHDRGFSVLTIDMRGHGASADAHFTFGLHERHDIEAGIDWLKGKGFKAGHIGLLGISMGAASSIGATADDADIGALVADSSYADIYPILEQEFPRATGGLPTFFLGSSLFMTRFTAGVNIGNSRPVTEIARIAPRPLLLIHATGDQLIPLAHAKQLAAAAPSAELWVITAGSHTGGYRAEPAPYVERVATFFNQALR